MKVNILEICLLLISDVTVKIIKIAMDIIKIAMDSPLLAKLLQDYHSKYLGEIEY